MKKLLFILCLSLVSSVGFSNPIQEKKLSIVDGGYLVHGLISNQTIDNENTLVVVANNGNLRCALPGEFKSKRLFEQVKEDIAQPLVKLHIKCVFDQKGLSRVEYHRYTFVSEGHIDNRGHKEPDTIKDWLEFVYEAN